MNQHTTQRVRNAKRHDQQLVRNEEFLGDVLNGLRDSPKNLPCKYFYDKRGSELFELICELDEYYLTRTELDIMERHAAQMGEQIGSGAMLVEFGSGASVKTRILLDHLPQLAAYVPVDISRDHLHQTADALACEYAQLEILPVCADFTQPFELPSSTRAASHVAVYFPGSTIGNFLPEDAQRLLKQAATMCGPGGGMLIGIDLQKDPDTIESAYNDAEGLTAAFNLNLLQRINRTLGADFHLPDFRHLAIYNEALGRVEVYLVSEREQWVRLNGELFHFDAGERICTEYSHKYTIDQFAEIAAGAGFTLRRHWTDDDNFFGVLHFVAVE
jgi:dimethylhistidine N-methyltransferase